MNYKNKYAKYKHKYEVIKGGNNDILFIFFNGGNVTKTMWFEFQNMSTNIINKVKNFGKVYLYDPATTLTTEKINNFKKSDDEYIFTM